eukprot:COSAG01_NODE_24395_length_780_cov_1.580029_1_plen_186_part_00
MSPRGTMTRMHIYVAEGAPAGCVDATNAEPSDQKERKKTHRRHEPTGVLARAVDDLVDVPSATCIIIRTADGMGGNVGESQPLRTVRIMSDALAPGPRPRGPPAAPAAWSSADACARNKRAISSGAATIPVRKPHKHPAQEPNESWAAAAGPNGCLIEAPWLANRGHGASFKLGKCTLPARWWRR